MQKLRATSLDLPSYAFGFAYDLTTGHCDNDPVGIVVGASAMS
jgi:hypothetical protein